MSVFLKYVGEETAARRRRERFALQRILGLRKPKDVRIVFDIYRSQGDFLRAAHRCLDEGVETEHARNIATLAREQRNRLREYWPQIKSHPWYQE